MATLAEAALTTLLTIVVLVVVVVADVASVAVRGVRVGGGIAPRTTSSTSTSMLLLLLLLLLLALVVGTTVAVSRDDVGAVRTASDSSSMSLPDSGANDCARRRDTIRCVAESTYIQPTQAGEKKRTTRT
jgi:hypothetical protein